MNKNNGFSNRSLAHCYGRKYGQSRNNQESAGRQGHLPWDSASPIPGCLDNDLIRQQAIQRTSD